VWVGVGVRDRVRVRVKVRVSPSVVRGAADDVYGVRVEAAAVPRLVR
jgi:hypothetical protein